MNENKMKPIMAQIEGQEWNYWKTNKLTDFLTERNVNLSGQELCELAKNLIKKDVFVFLCPISSAMPNMASVDENFVEMLESIIDKIKNDMTQGPFIESLILTGKSDPELAMKIAYKLIESDNPEYASFLAGGAFHGLPRMADAFMKKLFSSKNPRHQVTAIRTMRVAYKNSAKHEQRIFDDLEKASESDHIQVKTEAMEALLDFYKTDARRGKKLIESLAKSHTRCRYSLVVRIRCHSPFDKETDLYFLEMCSEDSDINVRKDLFYALSNFAKKHHDRVLEILAKCVIRDRYDLEGMGYVLNEMGKTNAAAALSTILDWIRQERDVKLTRYSDVMIKDLVSKADKSTILEPIFHLIKSEPRFTNRGLSILLEIISENYKGDTVPKFISDLFESLATLAKERKIDAAAVIKNGDNQILQCADVIHNIMYRPKPLDYGTIFQNLDKFPNIKDLFGISWFEQKRKEDNRTHPILITLGQKLPPDAKYDELVSLKKNAGNVRETFNATFNLKNFMDAACFLEYLDHNIRTMRDAGLETGGYSKNLRNEPQFAATLSEIDFIVPFLDQYMVEPEPKINSKRLDARIEFGAKSVYVEIVSPEMFKPLSRLRGTRTVQDRIRDKIYDKFKHQLKESGLTDQPVILAIDMGNSEVNYDFIEDYLLGPLKFKMYFDQEKSEAVDSHAYRDEKESMHGLDPETDLIGAVVCYETRFHDDLSYRTEGRIYGNKHAKTALGHDVIRAIRKSLFTTRYCRGSDQANT